MTRLTAPQLPIAAPGSPVVALTTALTKALKPMVDQINAVSSGQASAAFNATTAAPVGGKTTYAKGDFIKNSNPVEQGAAGSEFIIIGWICTVGGTPGTWKQCRVLTGD